MSFKVLVTDLRDANIEKEKQILYYLKLGNVSKVIIKGEHLTIILLGQNCD
jgi:hypothetical protein